jgi:hypothetical protein
MNMAAVVNQIEQFDDDFPQAEAVLPAQFRGVRRERQRASLGGA